MSDKAVATEHKISNNRTGVFITNFSERNEVAYTLSCGSITNEKFCKVNGGQIVFENTFAYFEIVEDWNKNLLEIIWKISCFSEYKRKHT